MGLTDDRRWLGRGLGQAPELLAQVLGELAEARVIEGQGVGNGIGVAKLLLQPVAQLHSHQRVHPQLEEPGIRSRGLSQTQDLPQLAL